MRIVRRTSSNVLAESPIRPERDVIAMAEIDLDDDGSIEATHTATWEFGDCTEAFVWAPNGRPEFVELAGMPYVPGAGWQSLRNCPEPLD